MDPSRKAFLAIALAITVISFTAASAMAGAGYSRVILSQDQSRVDIFSGDGAFVPASKLPEQVAFDHPRVSPDGKYVGWLALFPYCCASYPIPLALVVMDADGRRQAFTGTGQAIFRWSFVPESGAVAYMQTVLHGSNFEHFELRSLKSGQLLAVYDYPDDDEGNLRARALAPSWVRRVPE